MRGAAEGKLLLKHRESEIRAKAANVISNESLTRESAKKCVGGGGGKVVTSVKLGIFLLPPTDFVLLCIMHNEVAKVCEKLPGPEGGGVII